MPIRDPAARRLARQLLERRPPRDVEPSDEFVDFIARVIITYVEIDEVAAANERITAVLDLWPGLPHG